QLHDVISRNARHPGINGLTRILGELQGEPSRSGLEEDFLRLCKRHRLPTPQVNVHVGGHRVDAYFAEHRLIVEVDGYTSHSTKAAFARDRSRDVEILVQTGIPTIRFTKEQVTRAQRQTAKRLRTILERRGGSLPP
ncbi:MAG TPA: DUF559 domain-containing protein, partial [Solirubrobacteraceae bacterium]|nr:DUF559 domain-containing protein [Solirubrobacteraceae bacterium]